MTSQDIVNRLSNYTESRSKEKDKVYLRIYYNQAVKDSINEVKETEEILP